jgi:hypothetical protein
VGPEPIAGLRAERRVFVPANGRFVRILDVLQNTTSSAITAGYYVEQAHASTAGSWTIAATSSGDQVLDTSDDYLTMTALDPDSPAMAWVFAGAGATTNRTDTNTVSEPYQDAQWTWFWDQGEVTVPPGGKAILMRFAVRRPAGDIAGAEAAAQSLRNLTDPDALTGLTDEERAAVANFAVPPAQP